MVFADYPNPELFYERWELAGGRKIVNVTAHTVNFAMMYWRENEARAIRQYNKVTYFLDEEFAPDPTDLSETEYLLYAIVDEAAKREGMKLKPGRLAKALDNTSKADINQLTLRSLEKYGSHRAPRYFAFTVLDDADNDDIIQEGILFWPEDHVLHVMYVTRFMMGLVERVERNLSSVPNVDALFRMVMRFNKEELGCTTLAITHVTWGSTDMLQRNQTPDALKRGVVLDEPQDDEQQYATDAFRMERRLCDGPACLDNEATHEWAHRPEFAFCGAQCARDKWRLLKEGL